MRFCEKESKKRKEGLRKEAAFLGEESNGGSARKKGRHRSHLFDCSINDSANDIDGVFFGFTEEVWGVGRQENDLVAGEDVLKGILMYREPPCVQAEWLKYMPGGIVHGCDVHRNRAGGLAVEAPQALHLQCEAPLFPECA